MFRMSQKLLILLVILSFNNILWGNDWKLIGSMDKGPLGIHFKLPMSLYFYAKKNIIYIADSGNNRLLSFTTDGKPLKEFNANGKLNFPVGMVKDAAGNILIIEKETNSLVVINLFKKKIDKIKLKYNGITLFPEKIDILKNNIVILDRFTGKIFIFNDNFKVENIIFPEDNDFKGFFDMKIKDNHLWAMETLSGRLYRFDLKDLTYKIITPNKKFSEPVSFEVDNNGNIYILDRFMQKVFIFDKNGRFLNTSLKKGNKPGELYYPWYLKIINNKIFLLDEGNGRIDIFKF